MQSGRTSLGEHLHILAADLRRSARVLTKAPGFVFAALLAIVLGVTSTTVVFSLINAVLIRSLPYGNAERLVYMWTAPAGASGLPRELGPYYSDVAAWQRASKSFEAITGLRRYMPLLTDGRTQRVGGARVLGNFFLTLEARPELGRTIQPEDDQPGNQFVAVISDALWRSRFGGDPNAIGKTILINRHLYRVIGVMPREFSYPGGNDYPHQPEFARLARTDVWVPLALTPKQQSARDSDEADAIVGRLRGEISVSQAQWEISAIQKRLEPVHPEGALQALLVPFVEAAIGPVRPLMRLLMGAVCLVLLLACGNLASLLLARATNRVHEMGVRTALGAQRSRLVRMLVTESMLLALVGGALAVGLSLASTRLVVKLNPGDIPRFEETAVDWHVLLFGLAVAVGTGFAAGILPAVSASFVNVSELLRQGGRGTAGGSFSARNALVVSEIALAVVLLAGAGLLIRSYLVVQGEDKGFAPSTLTMNITLDEQAQGVNRFRSELMRRIQDLPGVQEAGSIDDLPLGSNEDIGFLVVEGYTSKLQQWVRARGTAGEYFRAMQIPLIAGRYLNDSDVSAKPFEMEESVVVSESFAKRYFPGRNALGHRLGINGPAKGTIVGIVGDVRHSSLEEAPQPIVYAQNGLADSVVIRTFGSPEAIVASVRKEVSAFGAGAAVTDVQTMSQYVDQAAARRRFQTVALAAFAGVAVFLTLVGLYGLIAYAVRQRTAEIGVRMALGATSGAMLRMVILSGLKLTLAGLGIGVCLALVVARGMAGFVYGIPAIDPVTFLIVPAFMIAVTMIACIAPAWKAARIDPVDALRQQ
ncbi:MAG TPA: ABC transporter permease [Bryobacteraceae bacterium]|nr:ABC transporter permease [Bryobacteraceae bacterium]